MAKNTYTKNYIIEKYPQYNFSYEHLNDLQYILNDYNPSIDNNTLKKECFDTIEKYGLNNNLKDLKDILYTLYEGIGTYKSYIQKLYINVILAKYDKTKSLKERLKTIEEMSNLRINYDYLLHIVFDDKEISSYELAQTIINNSAYHRQDSLKYLNENDREKFIKDNYTKVYTSAYYKLSNEEREYVINKIRETDEIYLSRDTDRYASKTEASAICWKSDLIKKLKEVYGKSYVEKTHKSLDDTDEFVYTMLNSNVLEKIYTKSLFTVEDTTMARALISALEQSGKDVTNIRKRDGLVRQQTSLREKSLYVNIVKYKDNKELLESYLKDRNITKENFFRTISSRKFLDKKLKESILLILAKYYNTSYISVYDILDMIDESHTRDISLNDILKERGINTTYFNKIYKALKEEQPYIYDLIHASKINKNSNKLLKLYYSITNDGINNYEDFLKKYKQTPEEFLEQFNNSPLFDMVYKQITSWYNILDGLPDIKKR